MLDKILATKAEEIKDIKLEKQVHVPFYSLKEALEKQQGIIRVIAEVKKASPSKGVIREDFDPVSIAKSYEAGGAAALSVLTDVTYFQGAREYVTAVKQAVNLPVLRKDFIIDEKQIEESRRIGADAILLIAEAMKPSRLHELYKEAKATGLDVLVECHSKDELTALLDEFEPEIIGINNRDLKTFYTSLDTTRDLSALLPEESLLVSESGIATYEDVLEVKKAGARGVLVGESLMRQPDVEQALRKLLGETNVSTDI
ncbi:indole-3-glycerol phosphate synthase [Sinobaca qinghaiensis]|uniref:Indole-3-glycerol phosphate synthase n=1 Tax=Sinobaca qinghaiensis TaxID=342944 RepID=A0A419V2X5_9BACL|nr:indole-3-glycerol phosphate synthase TrpC [Sinobaca qinghaiensis]RKD72848.1 indole-3-glycerol phosphate synthase [Sinobaca qinghaiensis]